MNPTHPATAEALLVSLLASALDDNVSIMRHEDTIRVLAAAAAPRFDAALKATYQAGVVESEARLGEAGAGGNRGGVQEASGSSAAAMAFADSLSLSITSHLETKLLKASSSSGPGWTTAEVMRTLKEADRAQTTEREAAGEDATLLKNLAKEYDYRVAEAVDEDMAASAREMARRLRALAARLDLRITA